MKVQITLELDVPTEGYTEDDIKAGMLEQVTWDETMGALKKARQAALLDFAHISNTTENVLHKTLSEARIKHYEKWLKIMEKSVWKFRILEV